MLFSLEYDKTSEGPFGTEENQKVEELNPEERFRESLFGMEE